MAAPLVFFDIAGEDDAKQREFFTAVFGWEYDEAGQFEVEVVTPLKATMRKDPADKMLYLGVDDIKATEAKIVEHGGSIEFPRFEVPGQVVLSLFKDPAGNHLGLVEMENGAVKVP